MKEIALLLFILLSSSGVAFSASGLELLVTCDQGAEAEKAGRSILDEIDYKPDGRYFFKPITDQQAFGGSVLYAGIAGVDMLPGANVTVTGDFRAILTKVKEVFSGEFECGEFGCASKINDDLLVAVYQHPTMEGKTIVQCGYTGP